MGSILTVGNRFGFVFIRAILLIALSFSFELVGVITEDRICIPAYNEVHKTSALPASAFATMMFAQCVFSNVLAAACILPPSQDLVWDYEPRSGFKHKTNVAAEIHYASERRYESGHKSSDDDVGPAVIFGAAAIPAAMAGQHYDSQREVKKYLVPIKSSRDLAMEHTHR